ncbi:hypothetical protein XGA_0964 [Xanthomonas hortorum ATCC 19865]|nr:hypothetical protein XGA_0964 [Xanthomonas hortorum ATCC 19865]
MRAAQRGQAALVDDQQVELVQAGGVQCGALAQLHAGADRDLAAHVQPGIAGPAAQVFQFRLRRAGQQQHTRGRHCGDQHRHLYAAAFGACGIAQAQCEHHLPCCARQATQMHLAGCVGYGGVDHLAGGIE